MISEQIKDLISDFELESIPNNPSYAKNQLEILELIDSYWMDKYKNNEYDSLGVKKCFYNIVENPTLVASKMIDLDTKDVRVVAEDGQEYYPAWFMNKDVKIYMKDKKNEDGLTFGQLLNLFVYSLPKYGHLLVKKVGDSINVVPLQNIICEQNRKGFLDCDILIEKHCYTPTQFKRIGKEKGWDWKKTYDKFSKADEFIVYEVFGAEDEEGNNYFIIPENLDDKFIIHKDKIDRNKLYKEIKWDDIPGRTLGRGQVEKLFEAQIHMNTIANYKKEGLHWTSKHIYQSRDGGIGRNLMTQTENGDIIIANSEISPIANEERNLSAYREEEDRWDTLIDRRTFAFDVMRGERAPSSTPLGSSILQSQMASGFFDLKKEDLGMFIKSIIYDWIIPDFKKSKRGKHNIPMGEFNEGELMRIRNLTIINKTNEKIIDYILKNKKIPNSQEFEIIRSLVKEQVKSAKSIEIPQGFYDNLKYKIDIIITGEQVDVASKLASLQQVMGIVGTNPTLIKDPTTRQFLFQMMDLAGISPAGLEGDIPDVGDVMAQAQLGGSVPAPTPQPVTNQTQITQQI